MVERLGTLMYRYIPFEKNWKKPRGVHCTLLFLFSKVNHWDRSLGYILITAGIPLCKVCLKGTQDWEFFLLRFWNLHYFFVSYVKILRFYKKKFLIGSLLGEVRFLPRSPRTTRNEKNFWGRSQKFFFLLLQFWTLNMTQY